MIVSTLDPKTLVESLEKEEQVLIPLADYQPALNPVSLEGIWDSIVVDDEDIEAAHRSLFKPIHDPEL
jgi:hypothetical protein